MSGELAEMLREEKHYQERGGMGRGCEVAIDNIVQWGHYKQKHRAKTSSLTHCEVARSLLCDFHFLIHQGGVESDEVPRTLMMWDAKSAHGASLS